jgi:hypothetical protein
MSAGGGVALFMRVHQGGGDLPPGEQYYEGLARGSGDVYAVFRNAGGESVTVRRVDPFTDTKLGEAVFQPGAASAWGAQQVDESGPSMWVGPSGATFTLGRGQTAFLNLGRRAS